MTELLERPLPAERPEPVAELPWVRVAPGAPYFATEDGGAWTPIGANESITWPGLHGLYRRRDPARAEAYLRALRDDGTTVLRLMLEYCQTEHRYFERPAGTFAPHMVRLWDDLFAACARHGLRVLLTPFDTFFTWRRWSRHPYNVRRGGPCRDRSQLLICRDTRAAIKARLRFVIERWGGSGALFAWDIWNEMHPAHCDDRCEFFDDFIQDVATHVRELELRLYGRAHPQTVSIFGPELIWKPWLRAPLFRHAALDFANSHFYEEGTIDHPADTVMPAIAVGELVRDSLAEIADRRPFFDSEHGPIHTFKDHHRALPPAFDDEYFRHIQWAHLASGGAGGGMRWPNRHPHLLTPGMRRAQRALAAFLPCIDWLTFRRRNRTREITVAPTGFASFACADESQALVWLVRSDSIGRDGMLRRDARPRDPRVTIPGLAPGIYRVTAWDTERGTAVRTDEIEHDRMGPLRVLGPPVVTDVALAVRRVSLSAAAP